MKRDYKHVSKTTQFAVMHSGKVVIACVIALAAVWMLYA